MIKDIWFVGVQNVEPTSYGRLGNMMSSIGFGDKFAWADKCFNYAGKVSELGRVCKIRQAHR